MATAGTTVIKGTFFFPSLAEKNKLKNRYTLDVGRLDKEALAKLKAVGVAKKVKVDKPRDGYSLNEDTNMFEHVSGDKDEYPDRHNREKYIMLQSNFPLDVVDKFGKEMDGSIVANGSYGQARVCAFEWTFQGNKGDAKEGTLGAGFNKVVVNDLVTWQGKGSDDADFDFEAPDDTEDDTADEVKEEASFDFEDA